MSQRKNPNLLKIQYPGLKKSGTIILPSEKNKNLRKINFINITESPQNEKFLNLPIPEKKRRYVFGDFVSFVKKVNTLHRFILIKNSLKSTTYKFEEEIRNKFISLKKNNVYNYNFSKYIQNIFSDINFNFNYYERNYQGKLNAYNLCLKIKKYLLLLIIKKINIYIKDKKNKAIKIQSNIRRLILVKKFNLLKEEMNLKAIKIQKYIRRIIIKEKYKDKLQYINDKIVFNKNQKEYEKRVKIMIKRRNAVRVIEIWWEKILEERKQKELEEKIKKMPIDCQKLYRQFVKLRKQTKSIKNEFKEFAKNKI